MFVMHCMPVLAVCSAWMCCLEVFSVVNVYLYHLKLCVACIDGRRYVCCGEYNGVSNECNEPTSCLVQPIGTHGGEVMYIDTFMCVVNKQFKLLEFVCDFVYVDLQLMRFLSLLLVGLCPCVVSVVLWSSLVCL